MSPETKAKRRPMRERVTQQLRIFIQNGDLAPGKKLAEEELARLVGTSRTPVREALHALEKEGLVTLRRGGGYEVSPFTTRELTELVGVRSVLEAYAVKLAARRLSPEMLDRLEANLNDFEAAVQAQDIGKLVELNTVFHDTFYRLANNRILTRLINSVADRIHRFRVTLLTDPQAAAQALADHRSIVEALKHGRYQDAADAAGEHLLNGGRWMLNNMGGEEFDEI